MNPLLDEAAQRHLVLASRSPRRYDLMAGMGFEFEVIPAGEKAEREAECADPHRLPEIAARLKCD